MSSDLSAAPYDTLIFQHIPKTAGSTLHGILNRRYPKSAIYNVFGANHRDSEIRGLERLSSAEKKRIMLVKGHMPFGVHKYFEGRCVYVTVLRDPVARAVSQYFYIRRNVHNSHHDYVVSNDLSLGAFVASGVAPGLNDGQVRWLSGDVHAVGFGETNGALLDVAKQHLENHFVVAGFTERFDETLLLLRASLGWRQYPVYRKENVARKEHKNVEISEADLEVVRDYNRLDIALYEFAMKRFDQQYRAVATNRDLSIFRKWNRAYRSAFAPYEYLAKLAKPMKGWRR